MLRRRVVEPAPVVVAVAGEEHLAAARDEHERVVRQIIRDSHRAAPTVRRRALVRDGEALLHAGEQLPRVRTPRCGPLRGLGTESPVASAYQCCGAGEGIHGERPHVVREPARRHRSCRRRTTARAIPLAVNRDRARLRGAAGGGMARGLRPRPRLRAPTSTRRLALRGPRRSRAHCARGQKLVCAAWAETQVGRWRYSVEDGGISSSRGRRTGTGALIARHWPSPLGGSDSAHTVESASAPNSSLPPNTNICGALFREHRVRAAGHEHGGVTVAPRPAGRRDRLPTVQDAHVAPHVAKRLPAHVEPAVRRSCPPAATAVVTPARRRMDVEAECRTRCPRRSARLDRPSVRTRPHRSGRGPVASRPPNSHYAPSRRRTPRRGASRSARAHGGGVGCSTPGGSDKLSTPPVSLRSCPDAPTAAKGEDLVEALARTSRARGRRRRRRGRLVATVRWSCRSAASSRGRGSDVLERIEQVRVVDAGVVHHLAPDHEQASVGERAVPAAEDPAAVGRRDDRRRARRRAAASKATAARRYRRGRRRCSTHDVSARPRTAPGACPCRGAAHARRRNRRPAAAELEWVDGLRGRPAEANDASAMSRKCETDVRANRGAGHAALLLARRRA